MITNYNNKNKITLPFQFIYELYHTPEFVPEAKLDTAMGNRFRILMDTSIYTLQKTLAKL